jgi:peptidoglycan/LPS O-acetylase OafA/YrhL
MICAAADAASEAQRGTMPIQRLASIESYRALLAGLSNFPSRFRRKVSGGTYRPEIDGLRFFAIAIVILGHLFQRGVRFFPNFRDVADGSAWGGVFYLGPGLGVYLFFAISGFIIATQARKARLSPLSGAFLKAYFGRRILRIEPPYMILLVATWLLLTVTGYQPEGTNQFFTEPRSIDLSLISSLFYAHDLIWGTFPRLFPPGWTLEVEVQFYILAPLVFWLWFQIGGLRARLLFAVAVFLAGSVLSTVVPRQVGPFFVYYSILRFFPLFWLGILLADLREWLTPRMESSPAIMVTALGWLGLIVFVLVEEAPESMPSGLLFWGAKDAAIVAMFASAFASQSGFRRFCAQPWVSLIGGACYSLYLVHIQLIQTLSVMAAKLAPRLAFGETLIFMAFEVGVVLVVGLTFYVTIERFFMMPDWRRAVGSRLRLAIQSSGRGRDSIVATDPHTGRRAPR